MIAPLHRFPPSLPPNQGSLTNFYAINFLPPFILRLHPKLKHGIEGRLGKGAAAGVEVKQNQRKDEKLFLYVFCVFQIF